MRVTTGIYKGKSIGLPKGIRPTQDKVRKALFDILADVSGLSFLELFAGSGAVGIEALSRGAKEVVFVESNSACFKALRENLNKLPQAACSLRFGDAVKVIRELEAEKRRFDVIFLDPPYYFGTATPRANVSGYDTPPYRKGGYAAFCGDCAGVLFSAAKKTLQTLFACDILAGNGFIIAQHFKKDNLPEGLGVFSLFRQSRYGDTLLSFYRKG